MNKGKKITRLYAAIGTNIEGKEIMAMGGNSQNDEYLEKVISVDISIVKEIVGEIKDIAASQGVDLRLATFKRVNTPELIWNEYYLPKKIKEVHECKIGRLIVQVERYDKNCILSVWLKHLVIDNFPVKSIVEGKQRAQKYIDEFWEDN